MRPQARGRLSSVRMLAARVLESSRYGGRSAELVCCETCSQLCSTRANMARTRAGRRAQNVLPKAGGLSGAQPAVASCQFCAWLPTVVPSRKRRKL